MDTSFTRLVGCRLPLQQAGMGAAASVELAAAVSESGALGTLGAAGLSTAGLAAALRRVGALTAAPVAVNFLIPFLNRDGVVLAAENARLVEFFYGWPDPELVGLARAGGALTAWQVGSPDEAGAAADAGCDLVIAQGVEAGGHLRGEIGLLALLDLVLAAVDVPVMAAGGIGTARSVAAVLAAGAAGARVGTRFLAATEADVHPEYLTALLAAGADDTMVTTTFSAFWPEAPHRVLKGCVEAALALEDPVAGVLELSDGGQAPIPRLAPLPPGRSARGHIGAMAQYAGQSVGQVVRPTSAADIVAELVPQQRTFAPDGGSTT